MTIEDLRLTICPPAQWQPSRDGSGYTVGDYLFDRLAELGVSDVFGVPGDFTLSLLDRVLAHGQMQWIGNANELNAGYAADGYGRLRGMAALVTTFGVGELSAANAIAGSYAEHVPVVHIVGAPARRVQDTGRAVHHSLGDGDFERFMRMATEITCAQASLTADNATSEIDRVLCEVRRQSLPGYLLLPTDVAAAPADPPAGPLPRQAGVTSAYALSRFTRAAAALIEHHDVTVLADAQVQYRGAVDQLAELLDADSVTFATLMSGKGIVDESSPNYLGIYAGAASEDSVRVAVETAPVLVTAGVVFTDVVSGFFSHEIDPARTIEIGATQSRVAGQVFDHIDIGTALRAVAGVLVHRRRDAATPPSRPLPTPDQHYDPAAPLTQELLWDTITGSLDAGDVVVADQGTSYYGLVGKRFPAGVTFIGQPLWASIGYSLPAALGTSLAAPDRRSVVLVGDGAAQLTIQELGVFSREEVAPVIVVVNNHGYTIERAIHGENASYNDIVEWRWKDIPGALGVTDHLGFTARTYGELNAALVEAALDRTRVAFIEVVLPVHDVPPMLEKLTRAAAAANGMVARPTPGRELAGSMAAVAC